MAGNRAILVILYALLSAASACAWAQGAIVNPSFEEGDAGWVRYSLEPPPNQASGLPSVGCIGSGCTFDVLFPYYVPEGTLVCGMQSWGETKNGGVYQVLSWAGGQASIAVAARAYSVTYPEPLEESTPYNNGCRVRIGLLNAAAVSYQDRSYVTNWIEFPWGDFWTVRKLQVPGPGNYTLFIESVQPSASAIMSTLWDDVVFTDLPPITGSTPVVVVPDDPQLPDTTARVQWTTNVPSTSRVDYGLTTAYGHTVQSGTPVTSHVVSLSGLTPGKLYHFRVASTAADYADWQSDDRTFNMPIQITGIATRLSPDGQGMLVTWNTNALTTAQVEYGLTASYGQTTPEDTNLTTSHSVTLTGLATDADYHFRVWSRNRPLYTDAVSTDQMLHTPPPPSATLENPSFEQPHGQQSPSLYPWVQYARFDGSAYHGIDGIVGPYPKGGQAEWFASLQAYDGQYFVGAAANGDYKNGGVLQRVLFPPNQLCTLSARYATYRQGGIDEYTRVRLGIDPNGGVDPESSSIKWWSGYSPSNDDQWHAAAVSAYSGTSGIVTVFLDIKQQLPLAWHVAAIDLATFGVPQPMSIGALKASAVGLSAVLQDKIVTQVDPDYTVIGNKGYLRAYIEDDDRSAGVAVLFDTDNPDLPARGNKVTVTGSLSVRDQEAVVMADSWTVHAGTHPQPRPLAIAQSAVGGTAPNQPALYGTQGACTVGLRVRLFGRVRWAYPEASSGSDVEAYLDDGSGFADQSGVPGVRVILAADPERGVSIGDYVAATGVLSIRLIDEDGYPNEYDYYTYTLMTSEPEDWTVVAQGIL